VLQPGRTKSCWEKKPKDLLMPVLPKLDQKRSIFSQKEYQTLNQPLLSGLHTGSCPHPTVQVPCTDRSQRSMHHLLSLGPIKKVYLSVEELLALAPSQEHFKASTTTKKLLALPVKHKPQQHTWYPPSNGMEHE